MHTSATCTPKTDEQIRGEHRAGLHRTRPEEVKSYVLAAVRAGVHAPSAIHGFVAGASIACTIDDVVIALGALTHGGKITACPLGYKMIGEPDPLPAVSDGIERLVTLGTTSLRVVLTAAGRRPVATDVRELACEVMSALVAP